ncbi:hypothetical protein ACP70R_030449 [Stipagrostis hirtigluma subsp. patula]
MIISLMKLGLIQLIVMAVIMSCIPRHDPLAEEGEEDYEIERLFKDGKKEKKNDRPRDIGLIVEQFLAGFEVAAEEDAT